MRTLFLQAPSFDGFDGGAGARYQTKREIASFWYPTWLAQPAALVPDSKLIDAPPHRTTLAEVVAGGQEFRPGRGAHVNAFLRLGCEGDRGSKGRQRRRSRSD